MGPTELTLCNPVATFFSPQRTPITAISDSDLLVTVASRVSGCISTKWYDSSGNRARGIGTIGGGAGIGGRILVWMQHPFRRNFCARGKTFFINLKQFVATPPPPANTCYECPNEVQTPCAPGVPFGRCHPDSLQLKGRQPSISIRSSSTCDGPTEEDMHGVVQA